MKKHHIKKETVFHHISHTVERKISTEIFSTNFKVFDIVMRQQDNRYPWELWGCATLFSES